MNKEGPQVTLVLEVRRQVEEVDLASVALQARKKLRLVDLVRQVPRERDGASRSDLMASL